ncbi:hypothetical protein Tco_0369624 [Tanacetum coccineum]
MLRMLLLLLRITIDGSDLLIHSADAPSMPPLLSLPLSMACDDSDGCAARECVYSHGASKSLLPGHSPDGIAYMVAMQPDSFAAVAELRNFSVAFKNDEGGASITLFVPTDDAFVDILMRANFWSIPTEYVDDQMLIPKCASVVICRFPRFPCKPIADEEEDSKTSIAEDKKLYGTELLVEALCVVWPGMSGLNHRRAMYAIDARFLVGHFIQHCPTNGDPNFDIRRVIPPIGIPKSMLKATTDEVHATTNGSVMKPNFASFEMEMEERCSWSIHKIPVRVNKRCIRTTQVIQPAFDN